MFHSLPFAISTFDTRKTAELQSLELIVSLQTTARRLPLFRRCFTVFAAFVFVAWLASAPSLAFNLLAQRSLRGRDLQSAEDWLRWSTRFHAKNPRTEFLWARLCRKLREGEAMVTHLRQARLWGADVEVVRREELLARAQSGEIKPIQHELRELLIDQRDDGREISEALVNGLVINNQFEEAFTVLDAWKNSFPKDGHPDYVIGRIDEYQERNTVEAAYRATLQREPDHRPALYRLGRLLLRKQRADEAITTFQQLKKLNVGAVATLSEAEAFRKSGNGLEASRLLRPLLDIPRAAFERSLVLVDETPDEVSIELELGIVESELGNHAEALRLLSIALAQDPNNLTTRYAHAVELRETNSVEEAARVLASIADSRSKLTQVDRLVDEIHNSHGKQCLEEKLRVGELYMQHGSRKTGEFWLKQALLADPQNEKAHELLTVYYEEMSKTRPEFRKLADRYRRSPPGNK